MGYDDEVDRFHNDPVGRMMVCMPPGEASGERFQREVRVLLSFLLVGMDDVNEVFDVICSVCRISYTFDPFCFVVF